MIWLFVCLSVLSAFLISCKSYVFRPNDCLLPHSLSVIVLFFLFFRCRSSPEISKNVQDTPGQCPPSMDTTDACSLFPRNVNNLTVGPAVGSLTSWLASHKVDADLAKDGFKAHQIEHKFPLGTLALDLSLWVTSGQEKPIKSMLQHPS